jgi:hypothetical protein
MAVRGGPGRARRPRGGAVGTVPMQGKVPEHTRDRANAIADALGVSLSRYLEQLIEREQLGEHGRPVWAAEAGLLRKKQPDPPLPGMEPSAA